MFLMITCLLCPSFTRFPFHGCVPPYVCNSVQLKSKLLSNDPVHVSTFKSPECHKPAGCEISRSISPITPQVKRWSAAVLRLPQSPTLNTEHQAGGNGVQFHSLWSDPAGIEPSTYQSQCHTQIDSNVRNREVSHRQIIQ